MTVRQLIVDLLNWESNHAWDETHPPVLDLEIVLSCDAEGNGYSPLGSVDTAEYNAVSSWSGDLLVSGDVGYERDNAVVLWPRR